MHIKNLVVATLCSVLVAAGTNTACGQPASTGSGQDFPRKPLRIITGGAGGGNDFAARIVAQGISDPLGQPVVVENRGTLVAVESVAKALPDGYSMLINGGSTWLTPLIQKTPHEIGDLAPISLMVKEVTILVVHPSVPVNSVKELIAYAQAKPGTLNYSSTVIGGSSHLAAELFKSMAGVNIVHVPYKGSNPALAGLLAGEVQVAIDGVQLLPQIKSGKLKALGVSTAQPSPLAPGMPTIASTGLPGYEWIGMSGIWTRAKTPEAIINRLNKEIVRVLTLPEIKDRFFKAGAEVVASSPEQFAAIIKSDIVRMGKVIKDAGIKVD